MTIIGCSFNDVEDNSINNYSKRNSKYMYWEDKKGEARWIEIKDDGNWEPKDGLLTEFHDNGKIKITKEYQNGNATGKMLAWNVNGEMILSGKLINNKTCSDFKIFYSNGKPFGKISILNCLADQIYLVNESGKPIALLNFVQSDEGSFLQGDFMIAYASGSPKIVYKNGVRINYDINGVELNRVKIEDTGLIYAELSISLFKYYIKKSKTSELVKINSACLEGDCKNGFGTFVDIFGAKYKGTFKNGLLEGKGEIYDIFENLVYRGEFKNGYLHGKGHFYGSHLEYEGMFQYDVFNGFGKLTFTDDGSVYEGYFLNDLRHGKGKYTFKDGSFVEGVWENGEFLNE